MESSFSSKLWAGTSDVMRLTETNESINFLAETGSKRLLPEIGTVETFLTGTGCTRPRPFSPRFGGCSSFVPIATGVAVSVLVAASAIVSVAIGYSSVASVWAIGASTSAATGSGVCSASAFANASKQEIVAS